MTEYELEKMDVGDYIRDHAGNSIMKLGPDIYQHEDHYGNRSTYSGATIHAMTGGIGGALGSVSAGTSGSITINGSSIGQIYGPGSLTSVSWPPTPRITDEESKELDRLEQEHKAFIKQNRLNKFKALPRHLRQEIVDEAYIRDLVESLASDDDKDFADIQKLNELRGKKSNWNNGLISVSSVNGYFGQGVTVGRFESILRHYKTEELAKAHAEVCIEEELKD